MRRAAIFLVVATLIVSACGSGGAATGAASPASAIGSASQAVSPGPSVRPECPNPNGGECLGPLAAGAYTTTAFQPRLKYTVPSGWDNEEDLPGNFLLLPPGATLAGVDAGTSDYLGVYTQVAPDPNCATTAGIANPEPQAIAACIASRQGLVATEPQAIEIGGLTGYVLDVTLATGSNGTSLIRGVQPSGFEHGLGPGLTIRLYLLALRGGSLGIEIDDVGLADLTAYSDVVETFGFGL